MIRRRSITMLRAISLLVLFLLAVVSALAAGVTGMWKVGVPAARA